MVTEATIRIYEELAELHERRREARQRDLFLVLAADTAHSAGQGERAERLRQRLLLANPHHLLRPFTSFAEALGSPDIQGLVEALRKQFPPDAAEQLHAQGHKKPEEQSARTRAEPELKVFRVPETNPDKPRTVQSTVAATRASAVPPPRPRSGDSPYARGLAKTPANGRRGPLLDDPAGGGWLALALFGLLLLAGLGLAAYTLLGPLLSP